MHGKAAVGRSEMPEEGDARLIRKFAFRACEEIGFGLQATGYGLRATGYGLREELGPGDTRCLY
jgi:hypothetical protein